MTRKVCVITGGSSGIGAALVEAYAKGGFDVAFSGRRGDHLNNVLENTQRLYPETRLKAYISDVSLDEQMNAFQSNVLKDFKRVDVVIANAGYALGGDFEDLQVDQYRKQFEVNVFGVLRTIKAFLPDLKQSKGSIAIVGSVNSYLSLPSVSAYAMSKHALLALSESLRTELKPLQISVSMICPGFIESDIRQRDSDGKQVLTKKDYASRLAMRADRAAAKIKSAIDSKVSEKVITWHGYFAILLRRLAPGLTRFLTSFQTKKRNH